MADNTVELSVKGKWLKVPAVNLGGSKLAIKGRWIRVAAFHDEWWLENELEDPEMCVQKLKELGEGHSVADLFTFTQKVPGSLPKYEYALEWDSVAATRTSSFREWWENLPQEARKNVRRAHKRGVVITVSSFDDDLIRGIMDVNDDSPMRQGAPNVHYGKNYTEIKKEYSSFLDRSDFICAHAEGELIGFLKLVYRGEVAAILNLTTKPSHNEKRPANALIAKAMELCEAKAVSYLTYGMFSYGNKRESPLREFKVRNGFQEMLTPRFYIPLTRWGRLCMKLKLHRGLLGILPHRLITLGLSTRAKWYKLRYNSRAGVAQ